MKRSAIFEHAGREVDVWYAAYLKTRTESGPAANAASTRAGTPLVPAVINPPGDCINCGGKFRHKATFLREVDFQCEGCGGVITRRRT